MRFDVAAFIEELSAFSMESVFNPYRDTCPKFDDILSAECRRRILEETLRAASYVRVEALWVGRDLGHRGGRRTGIALTDDVHLPAHGERWRIKCERATVGPVVREQTATNVWQMLGQIDAPILTWNVYPFHPYPPENVFQNRCHTAAERRLGEEIFAWLFESLDPTRVIAIGNDAATSAVRVCGADKVRKVRHPSFGGKRQFLVEIGKLYGLSGDGGIGC